MEEYTTRSSAPLGALRATFQKHLYMPDTASVDFAAAVVIANRLPNDPVWGMIVGASGGGKTEAVQSVVGAPEAYELSTVTGKTFLSAKTRGEGRPPASLLHRLDQAEKRLLVLKDFTTILSMRTEDRAEILAALREIYDGSFRRETGMGDVLSWKGRLGFLAGVTPAIDLHHAVIGVLGERFVYLKLPDSDTPKITGTSLDEDDEASMRAELRQAMAEFVEGVTVERVPALTPEVRSALILLARRTAWLRSSVARDPYTRDILIRPTLEVPTRIAKQLRQIWRAAVLMGHEDPLAFVGRVARDSTRPADRVAAVDFVAGRGTASSSEIRRHLRLPWSSGHRLIEDLQALDIFEVIQEGGNGKPHILGITFAAQEVFPLHPGFSPAGEDGENISTDVVPGMDELDATGMRKSQTWRPYYRDDP